MDRTTTDVDTLIEYLQLMKESGVRRVVIGAPGERCEQIILFTLRPTPDAETSVYLVPGGHVETT